MRIAILAFPDTLMIDVIGPLDVFSEAAAALGDAKPYELQVIGIGPEPIVGSSGVRLVPDRTIADPDEPIDTLLVAGSYSIRSYARDPAIQAWLIRRAASVRRYGSVCHGALALAAAGLLDGRHATTHWDSTDELARDYPSVLVEPDLIFVRDGRLCTSAGATAGIDLALALVEEDFGRELALNVARKLVVFLKRPGGQSQFSAHLAAQVAKKPAIQETQAWILENLTANCSVESLAKRARMSTRNFTRIFRFEARTTPADFVEAARVDAAQRMIVETRFPMKLVAARCGFGNAAGLRRAFLRRLGVNPHDYRDRFGLKPLPGEMRHAETAQIDRNVSASQIAHVHSVHGHYAASQANTHHAGHQDSLQ